MGLLHRIGCPFIVQCADLRGDQAAPFPGRHQTIVRHAWAVANVEPGDRSVAVVTQRSRVAWVCGCGAVGTGDLGTAEAERPGTPRVATGTDFAM